MRLEYRILWIENDSDWKETTEDMIKDEIIEKGYILNTTFYKDYNVFLEETVEKDYGIYDLILVDFKLDNDLTGDNFIEKIRNNNVLTDVLFYSQNSDELKDKFSKNSLEGVYISNREDFEDKFFQVFRKTIKKLEELNAVRGLVMAETSRLDRIIEDILLEHIDSEDKIKSHAIKILEDSAKNLYIDKSKTVNERGNLKAKNIDNNLLIKRVLDASKRTRILAKLIEIKKIDIKFSYEAYLKDVIDIRNELAHAKSEIKDGKEILIVENKEGIEEKEFKQEDIVEIRKNILKYDKILKELKEKM